MVFLTISLCKLVFLLDFILCSENSSSITLTALIATIQSYQDWMLDRGEQPWAVRVCVSGQCRLREYWAMLDRHIVGAKEVFVQPKRWLGGEGQWGFSAGQGSDPSTYIWLLTTVYDSRFMGCSLLGSMAPCECMHPGTPMKRDPQRRLCTDSAD